MYIQIKQQLILTTMANLNNTKKQITKALKQLVSVELLEGRVSLTYDLPEGNVLENIEKFEKC